MERWRKIRNGAFFIDFLLVLAVIVAMLGLVTFARYRTGLAKQVADKRAPLAINLKHIEPLNPAPVAPTSDNLSNNSPDSSASNTDDQPQSTNRLEMNSVNGHASCAPGCAPDSTTEQTYRPLPSSVKPIVKKVCNDLRHTAKDLNSDKDDMQCPL